MAELSIAVMSDTHGLVRPEVIEVLKECDLIIHAGDFCMPEILNQLQDIAPVLAVRGNNDMLWAKDIPYIRKENIEGFSFLICHREEDINDVPDGTDFVIVGHTHQYRLEEKYGAFFLNPGSCGPQRFRLPVTMAILHLNGEEHKFSIEQRDIVPAKDGRIPNDTCLKLDMESGNEISANKAKKKRMFLTDIKLDYQVQKIMKDINKGKSVSKIASAYNMDYKLVESIVRMYLTHPGVSSRSIIDKLELRDLYRD